MICLFFCYEEMNIACLRRSEHDKESLILLIMKETNTSTNLHEIRVQLLPEICYYSSAAEYRD